MAPPTTPSRRSKRATQPKKYVNDPFEVDGLKTLLVVSSDSGSDTSEIEDSEDEEDFDIQQAALAEAELAAAENDEVMSAEEGAVSSGGGQTDTGNEDEDDLTASGVAGVNILVKQQKKSSARNRSYDESNLHQLPAFDERGTKLVHSTATSTARRGISDGAYPSAKGNRVIYPMGTGDEDLAAHIKSREKWINQPTFPSRSATKKNEGGLGLSPFHTKARIRKETDQSWQWYHEEGGHEVFLNEQKSSVLDTIESQQLLNRSLFPSDPFLIGPSQGPKLITPLKPCTFISTAEAWGGGPKSNVKNSWIINVGARVQCLEWVPNQKGIRQYLAVVTNDDNTNPEKGHPDAFAASTSHSMCLQIWEFVAKLPSKEGRQIDFSEDPVLRVVISSSWGNIKKLKWNPVPERESDVDISTSTVRLGLLAGVWADGKVRVLDVQFPRKEAATTQYMYMSKAVFESKPHNTICTCVTWLSSMSLAAGCSNGYVAVWNLSEYLKSRLNGDQGQGPSTDARPWFYRPFHQGYILGITSAYPSRPQFIITKGTDGHFRMTDMCNPEQDTVVAGRDRVVVPPFMWHDVSQSALSTDDNYDIKSCALRLWHKPLLVGRLEALVMDMAGSPVHPFVLFGSADGSVWSTNPLKRLRQNRSSTYQQIWFKHEWRRPIREPVAGGNHRDVVIPDAGGKSVASGKQSATEDPASKSTNILSNSLVRFTEGYKLTSPDLSQGQRPNTTKEAGVPFTTIYEKKTAITRVNWNPNLTCGTWAAAGTASGLVRIEDLGVD